MALYQTMKQIRLLLLLISLLLGSLSYGYNLPTLGSPSALSPAQQKKLAREFMQAVRQEVPLVNDALVNNYVRSLGYKLASHSGAVGQRFHFFIVQSNIINAFSGPGGNIGIDSGLILSTQNESELAAVMAHEIAHTTQDHIAQTLSAANHDTWLTMGAMLAAIALGAAAHSPDAAVGGAMAASAGGTASMLSFSRTFEREADEIGMRTLYKSGFNPYGMPDFFAHMQRLTMDDDDLYSFLNTHPVTQERIADAENRAAQYPKRKYRNSMNYYLMRARLRALYTPYAADAVNFFKAQLNNKSPAVYYGYSIALMRNFQYDAATTVINQLIQQNPNQIIYPMALAEIETAQKNYQAAANLLAKNYDFYPDYQPLQVQYATVLLHTGNSQKAVNLLQKILINEPDNLELNQLLATAQAQSGHLADAYQTQAKVSLLQGDKERALIQLKQALTMPHLDHDTRLMIQSQIASLQNHGTNK